MTMSKVPQIREPLATSTLILAGVPVQHVLWFKRLSPPAKMQALATEQGEQILKQAKRAYEIQRADRNEGRGIAPVYEDAVDLIGEIDF